MSVTNAQIVDAENKPKWVNHSSSDTVSVCLHVCYMLASNDAYVFFELMDTATFWQAGVE
jgi:hypothetical protein